MIQFTLLDWQEKVEPIPIYVPPYSTWQASNDEKFGATIIEFKLKEKTHEPLHDLTDCE